MNVTLPFEIAEAANGLHYAAHPHISASHYGTTPAAKKKLRQEIKRTVDAALETHENSYLTKAIRSTWIRDSQRGLQAAVQARRIRRIQGTPPPRSEAVVRNGDRRTRWMPSGSRIRSYES